MRTSQNVAGITGIHFDLSFSLLRFLSFVAQFIVCCSHGKAAR